MIGGKLKAGANQPTTNQMTTLPTSKEEAKSAIAKMRQERWDAERVYEEEVASAEDEDEEPDAEEHNESVAFMEGQISMAESIFALMFPG